MIPLDDYLLDEPPREEPDDDECECDDLRCPECWERAEYRMDASESFAAVLEDELCA